MCGICGIINIRSQKVEEAQIKKMMTAIKHRGPDAEGCFVSNNVGLGFVRLSIIDLSSKGNQPMHSLDDRYIIVFNGEIYNYIEIRELLKSKGYTFISNTDTEVLLNAYAEWGEACLDRLNGMFAFVIYDKANQKIFCARDRFGVKPFYYYWDNERFVFSSEIAGIISVVNKYNVPNEVVIYNYLVFNRTDFDDQTFFNSVKKLTHGSKISLDISSNSANLNIVRWYNLSENIHNPFKNTADFLETFIDAVRLRLKSDVPVSVCLSGGLDSSSILSVMLKKLGIIDVHTFSAIYGKGNFGDESEYIDLYKDDVKNMHFAFPTADSLFDELTHFVETQTEPVQSTSIYAQYKVFQIVNQQKIKVLLSGQGADEQLGGYHYFFSFFFKELFFNFRFGKFFKELNHCWQNHHSILPYKFLIFYSLPISMQNALAQKASNFLTDHFDSAIDSKTNKVMNLYNSRTLQDAFLQHFEYKLEHLLKWDDINSMRFSVEVREPFLDYRLVEKTLALKADQIINNGTTKLILREAMKGILPEPIRTRQSKIGFATPEAEWFKLQKYNTLILDVLNSKSFKERGYISPNKALALFEKHKASKINISRDIWKWINLELWFKRYIDNG